MESYSMLDLTAPIDATSVFLVSGGARGVTAHCVLRLAQQYDCKWILLGRSAIAEPAPAWAEGCFDPTELKQRALDALRASGEKPTPVKVQKQLQRLMARRDIETTLRSLAQLGRSVEYLSVDVTDLPTLQAQLTAVVERWRAITGIVHGAGNLADKLIENKTAQDFDLVYAAKVQGLANLLSCVPASQIRHLVLFSSVAGFYGNAGQADYAIANEILNKSAHLIKRHHPHCHVVSINWGPWDSGMVTAELKQAFAARQIEVIPLDVGAQLFGEELATAYHATAQVVIGSPLTRLAGDLDPQLRTHRIRRKLTLAANPFLPHHVIGGQPVLPAMCAAAWMITTCERLYPGYTFSCLEQFKVLKGIVFDRTQPEEFIIDVQELAKLNAAEIRFDLRIWSEPEIKKIRFHYSGQVILRRQLLPAPIDHPFHGQQAPVLSGQACYQAKTLFHGPYFQGIEQVLKITPELLIMQCFLPMIEAEVQGQFPVEMFNPYSYDVVIQSILVWLRHCHETSALPLEIQQVTQFKPIAFDQRFYVAMQLQRQTATEVITSLTVYDDDSVVCARLSGVKMVISDRLNQLFARSPVVSVEN
jgi:NAD(P)-dependent dehydrogenase (short-subunit alcohol dehydrogenase family)